MARLVPIFILLHLSTLVVCSVPTEENKATDLTDSTEASDDDLDVEETGWLFQDKSRELENLKNRILSPFAAFQKPYSYGTSGISYPNYNSYGSNYPYYSNSKKPLYYVNPKRSFSSGFSQQGSSSYAPDCFYPSSGTSTSTYYTPTTKLSFGIPLKSQFSYGTPTANYGSPSFGFGTKTSINAGSIYPDVSPKPVQPILIPAQQSKTFAFKSSFDAGLSSYQSPSSSWSPFPSWSSITSSGNNYPSSPSYPDIPSTPVPPSWPSGNIPFPSQGSYTPQYSWATSGGTSTPIYQYAPSRPWSSFIASHPSSTPTPSSTPSPPSWSTVSPPFSSFPTSVTSTPPPPYWSSFTGNAPSSSSVSSPPSVYLISSSPNAEEGSIPSGGINSDDVRQGVSITPLPPSNKAFITKLPGPPLLRGTNTPLPQYAPSRPWSSFIASYPSSTPTPSSTPSPASWSTVSPPFSPSPTPVISTPPPPYWSSFNGNSPSSSPVNPTPSQYFISSSPNVGEGSIPSGGNTNDDVRQEVSITPPPPPSNKGLITPFPDSPLIYPDDTPQYSYRQNYALSYYPNIFFISNDQNSQQPLSVSLGSEQSSTSVPPANADSTQQNPETSTPSSESSSTSSDPQPSPVTPSQPSQRGGKITNFYTVSSVDQTRVPVYYPLQQPNPSYGAGGLYISSPLGPVPYSASTGYSQQSLPQALFLRASLPSAKGFSFNSYSSPLPFSYGAPYSSYTPVVQSNSVQYPC